jgi:hypothetical protein
MVGTASVSCLSRVRIVTTAYSQSFVGRNRSRPESTRRANTILDGAARGRLRAPRVRLGWASDDAARFQAMVRPSADLQLSVAPAPAGLAQCRDTEGLPGEERPAVRFCVTGRTPVPGQPGVSDGVPDVEATGGPHRGRRGQITCPPGRWQLHGLQFTRAGNRERLHL